MIKTLTNLRKQEKEKFVVPKGVQDVIPITAIYDDGIFQIGKDKFSKTYKFSDINYAVASREDKEAMFLEYSELLNSLDSGATTKITINNRRLNRLDFENNILIPMKGDSLDEYREEYNKILLEKATGANAIVQDKYMTISVNKKNIEDARNYFARVGADLIAHFGRLGSKCLELETDERLRIFHDFYRVGEESSFHFDIKETRKKGHSFKDYICPDSMEFEKDYFKMGDRYGRVLFLREYASYIKDSMVAELTDLNRNLMMSIDVVPVPTDEAVREAENRLLGVETNITNWQRRQNSNNNFSATVPYDMEQQKKEMKEFLDDLTTRDQRMMFAVITFVHTADSKEQLDNDTEALIPGELQKVWELVLNTENYAAWRSDLSKTEAISDKQFIEYTKNGYPTTFTVTLVKPYRRWEFDMENSNMTGHWTGIFTAKGDETEIDFTEQVKAKKWLLKPFVKSYLRKQQTQFVADIMKNFS